MIRPGQDPGDRLVWRYPVAHPDGKIALAPVQAEAVRKALADGQQPPREPAMITVGYYIEMEDPDWGIAFMPVTTPWAIAALSVATVQRRIADDLITRIEHPEPTATMFARAVLRKGLKPIK